MKNKYLTRLKLIGSEVSNAIKEALNEEGQAPEIQNQTITLVEFTLSDGEIINVEGELTTGSIVTKDGQPILDGLYSLSDNSQIRCESGIITEVIPAPATEQTKEIVSVPVEQSKVPAINTETTSSLESDNKEITQLTALCEVLQNQIKDLHERFEIQTKVNIELNKQVELIGNQPATKPIVKTEQTEEKQSPKDEWELDRLYNEKAKERMILMNKKNK